MTRIAILLALLAPSLGVTQDDTSVFVPRPQLTEAVIDEELARLRAEGIDLSADDIDWSSAFTYRDTDFRNRFPELTEEFSLKSVCSNSIMSGATSVAFLSPVSEDRVIQKTLRCSPASEGLYCGPVNTRELFSYASDDLRFELIGVAYSEAREILGAYRANGIVGFDEWHQKAYSFEDVKLIRRHPEGFEMELGEYFCGGCTSKVIVNLQRDGGELEKLVLVRIEESICI